MQDLRDAFRALRATPLVTAVAILSLALGIGANTAMFSIVDTLLLRSLPVRHAERLVILTQGDGRQSAWTNPIWEQVRDTPELFDGAFAWSGGRFNLATSGESDFIDGFWASGAIFEVLSVPAILGRTFTPADDRRGGGPDGAVAVISHGYWQRRYGGSADVIGQGITLNQTSYTIVGVTPPEFFGPEVGRTFDVAIPLGTEPIMRSAESMLDRRSAWWLSVMMRLKPGQPLEAAIAAIRTAQPRIREATLPDNWRPQDLAQYLGDPLSLRSAANGTSWLRTQYQRPLTTLLVVVGLVLLIACGNIANLLLARATARRHELSVRQALGASRWRLARQLLAESLLLSSVGAALGIVVAVLGSRLLVQQLSTQTNRVFLDLTLDWRFFAFTSAVAIATALLFGTAPALQAARAQPMDAMREQGRGNSGTRRLSLGGGLVVAQVALSLVLVVGAGLFVRTFASLADRELGFDDRRVLVVNVGAQRAGLDSAARFALFNRVEEATRAVPGVAQAAISAVTPVSGMTWNNRLQVVGGIEHADDKSLAHVNIMTPGWFATYGTPLLAGRDFDERDDLGAPKVAIVNQEFVRYFLGEGVSPLGRTIRMAEGAEQRPVFIEIVGLATDAVYRSLRSPIPPTMYFPFAQREDPQSSVSLSVRSAGAAPATLARSVVSAIADVDRNLTMSVRTLQYQVETSLLQERLVATLSAFFGALALLLAGLGLYGVTSYSVNRRRTELGIRMALGAAPRGVLQLVLRRVTLMVGCGVVIGALVSWWASRFVETLLYGLKPQDPLTLGAGIAVLVTIGLMAGWVPARRAARIDPAVVLREE